MSRIHGYASLRGYVLSWLIIIMLKCHYGYMSSYKCHHGYMSSCMLIVNCHSDLQNIISTKLKQKQLALVMFLS